MKHFQERAKLPKISSLSQSVMVFNPKTSATIWCHYLWTGPVLWNGTSWNPNLYTILNWETVFFILFPQGTKCLSLQEAVLMIEISALVLLLLKVLLFVFLSKSLLCRPHLKNERTRGYIVSDIFIVLCKAHFSRQRRQTPVPMFFYLFMLNVNCY